MECGIGITAGSLPMLGLFSVDLKMEKKWEELEMQYKQNDLERINMGTSTTMS